MDVPEDHHDQRQTNIVREIIRTPITDARDYEKVFDLDSHGFAFRKSKLEFDHSFDDEEDIEKHYLPGARDILLREVKDADEVFVFDWRVRFPASRTSARTPNSYNVIHSPPADPDSRLSASPRGYEQENGVAASCHKCSYWYVSSLTERRVGS